MEKLIIIIERENLANGGMSTKFDLLGNKELWKEVKLRVLEEVIEDLNIVKPNF